MFRVCYPSAHGCTMDGGGDSIRWSKWVAFLGKVDRDPIDEGGAFLRHQRVRIQHNGASAVSTMGDEVILRAADGPFAVQATSDLTDGKVPVFVAPRDFFSFSAVRLSAAAP